MYLVFQKPNSELWSKYYIRLLRHSPDCFSVWRSKCSRLNETVRKEESGPDLLIESCLTAAHCSVRRWAETLLGGGGGTGHKSTRSGKGLLFSFAGLFPVTSGGGTQQESSGFLKTKQPTVGPLPSVSVDLDWTESRNRESLLDLTMNTNLFAFSVFAVNWIGTLTLHINLHVPSCHSILMLSLWI